MIIHRINLLDTPPEGPCMSRAARSVLPLDKISNRIFTPFRLDREAVGQAPAQSRRVFIFQHAHPEPVAFIDPDAPSWVVSTLREAFDDAGQLRPGINSVSERTLIMKET